MTGYHYTTYSNWQKIKIEGLKPYPITDAEVISQTKKIPIAIWFFKNNPTGLNHVGNVILKAIKKREMHIVKLKCVFNKEDVYKTPKGQSVEISHDGSLDDKFYFHRDEPAILVVKKIPISNIRLMGVWDILEKLREIND